MIPRLYGAKETNFEHNGIGWLVDTQKCLITEEQNGMYELELTYKVGSFLCQLLVEDNIIKAKANDEHEPQLFRIYYVSEELDGTIQVKAEHISYDLRGNFLEGIFLANATCQEAGNEALKRLEEAHNFTFYSDIEHTANYNIARCNGLECIAGKRGSLLDTYGNGAKLIRDNFKISLVKSRGKNNNVLISYRKNMTGYKRELDITDIVTKIYPFALVQKKLEGEDSSSTVEEMLVLPERFITSKNYGVYSTGKILSLDYSGQEGIESIQALRKVSEKWFSDTKRDEPDINYQVEFVNLYKTSNYKNLGLDKLEKVCLDDVIIVRDFRFNRNIEARVIKTVYNALSERYEKIELGKFKDGLKLTDPDLNEKVDNTINKIKNMYVRFEVLDDKIVSEVSKLDGDIKTSTSLWQQEADNITSTVIDLDGKYTQIKQTVDSIDITGMVTFRDLESPGSTQISGANIITGTLSGNKISGGEIIGATLKTAEPSTNGGVWIKKDGMQIGMTSIHYSDNRFKIEANGNMSIASGSGGIYLIPNGGSSVGVSGTLECNKLILNGTEIRPGGGVAVFG